MGPIESISIADIFVKSGEGTGLKERTKQQSRAVPLLNTGEARWSVTIVLIEKDRNYLPADHRQPRDLSAEPPNASYKYILVTMYLRT